MQGIWLLLMFHSTPQLAPHGFFLPVVDVPCFFDVPLQQLDLMARTALHHQLGRDVAVPALFTVVANPIITSKFEVGSVN